MQPSLSSNEKILVAFVLKLNWADSCYKKIQNTKEFIGII